MFHRAIFCRMKKFKIGILLLIVIFPGEYAYAGDCPPITVLEEEFTRIYGTTATWQYGHSTKFSEDVKVNGTCGENSTISFHAKCEPHHYVAYSPLEWTFSVEAQRCNPATCKLDMADTLHMTMFDCEGPTKDGNVGVGTLCENKCSENYFLVDQEIQDCEEWRFICEWKSDLNVAEWAEAGCPDVCRKQECDMTTLSDGIVSRTGRKLPKETYACSTGFELSGPGTRKCVGNGVWEPTDIPKCTKITVDGEPDKDDKAPEKTSAGTTILIIV
eukprot:343617_1